MFSKELKEATKESHSAAENTKFVAGFLRGVVDPEEYRKLIANFWYVYSTMERLINDADDPTVRVLPSSTTMSPVVLRLNEVRLITDMVLPIPLP